MTDRDALLTRSFELAAEARAEGDHPFGALFAIDGENVAEARNRVNTDHDITAHAETHLVWSCLGFVEVDYWILLSWSVRRTDGTEGISTGVQTPGS